jgi:hypothetical protein
MTTHRYYEPIYGDFAFFCEYSPAEREVNAGATIDVLDIVIYDRWAGGWQPATFAEVQGIAREYELPRKGLSRDDLIDAIADRRGAREVAA